MAKDSYWFKHDSTAGRALKMRKMTFIHGHWGKGIYWDVIEILREQSGYSFSSNENDLQMLAEIIGCKDATKFTNWFNDCVNFELFKIEKGKFFSEILRENMAAWEIKKLNGNQGGRPKEKPNQNLNNNLNETESVTETKANHNLTDNRNETIRKEKKREEKNNIHDQFILGINSITSKAFRGNKKSQSSLQARLNEGYTLEQILTATKNCFENQYHKENPHYLSPEFILRADKLEKYLNIVPAEQKPEIDPKKLPTYDFFGVDRKPTHNV